MRNFSKIILTPLIVTLSLVFASCSDGGDGGGKVVGTGTPEKVAKCKDSYTGEFLKRILK